MILGDLNAYSEEDPIDILRAGIPATGSFTKLNTDDGYLFGGQVGSLDHAMVNPALFAQVSNAAKWNINAFEPISLDYNDNILTSGESSATGINNDTSLYVADPFRSSDHDPVLVGLSLGVPVTAAHVSISGRVTLPQKSGLTNALVTLTDFEGNSRTIRTGKSGTFRFTNVAAGETYILTVTSKRYTFASQIITANEDLTDVNFTAQ